MNKILNDGWLKLIILWLAMWLFLISWMWAVRQVFNAPLLPDSVLRPYLGTPLETNPWLEPWQRWDTPQYQAIAEKGYNAFDTALFTPPLFPFLMNLVSTLTGNTLSAGLLVSGLATLIALMGFQKLAKIELINSEDTFRSTLYFLSFPTAFFLFAAYSESLYLAAAIFCLYFARQNKWVLAGIAAGLAGLSRISGFFILIPFTYAVWQAWQSGDKKGWRGLLAGVALMGLFPVYAWLILNQSPFDIFAAHRQRGGTLTFPGLNIIEASRRIFGGFQVMENSLELIFTLIFIALTVFIWKNLPRIYGIYSLTLMLFFLTRMGSPQPLVAMARYVLEIFPAFFMLAQWGRTAWINRIILYVSWLGLLFLSAQFAIWGWVG